MENKWSKDAYEASVTANCWDATPYDSGWEENQKYGENHPPLLEIRTIFEEEMTLDEVPNWTKEIISRMIKSLPMCGHYKFPLPIIQICEAIGKEECPEFVCGCYTADSERKILMSYYVYCLDAWLKDAPLEIAIAELAMRDSLGKNWAEIITAIYKTLGLHTEHKDFLVKTLVHRLRWWVKTLIWFNDKRNKYMLDVYSGDIRGNEVCYGNSPFGDPYFAELRLPEIVKLYAKIHETIPDSNKLLDNIESTWLCAPKIFRYLEKIILAIGSVGLNRTQNSDLSILQCEDTYPNIVYYQKWYASFMQSLTDWLDGSPEAMKELGDITPVKHWLVRILRHKLQLYEKHDPFGKMIGAESSGKSGSGII